MIATVFAPVGCAAQPPTGVVEPGSKVSRNGCTVDPKQVCQICLRMFDQREVALYDNGVIKRDTHSLDQSERHLTILTDYRNHERRTARARSLSVRYADAYSHAGRSHQRKNTRRRPGGRIRPRSGLCL